MGSTLVTKPEKKQPMRILYACVVILATVLGILVLRYQILPTPFPERKSKPHVAVSPQEFAAGKRAQRLAHSKTLTLHKINFSNLEELVAAPLHIPEQGFHELAGVDDLPTTVYLHTQYQDMALAAP